MRELSIQQLRAGLSRLEEILESEGELVVTVRGQPIAVIRPYRTAPARPDHAELRAAMPRLATGSEQHVRTDRDER